MSLKELVKTAQNKQNFEKLDGYIDFARRFLDFIGDARNRQAEIVSQNETHYRFWQYREDGHHNVTRPINSKLMIAASQSQVLSRKFLKTLREAWKLTPDDDSGRMLICKSIYTIQQCIGAALDALPSGKSNTARKINGDLFERLIQLLISDLGVHCVSGTIQVPFRVDGTEYKMSYQHDLIIRDGEAIKVIGGVKTSSKDRLGKVFIDKFLYCALTETCLPHIAIFLNDVQRKKSKRENEYGVSATFLPGHFKGYTLKLNALDGVYYCDIRPNMLSDPLLAKHIRTIDHFFCSDLWKFVNRPGVASAEVVAVKP